MKIQRFLIALTILNFVLLLVVLLQGRPTGAQGVAPILRAKALEIVDDQGRERASISVLPASPMTNFPQTVILRLVDPKGKPFVKLAASEEGSVLLLLGESEATYAQIWAQGTKSFVKLTNQDGRERVVKP
jgi:hypothetical protein